MTDRKANRFFFISSALLALIVFLIFSPYSIRINLTPSHAYTLLLSKPLHEMKKDSFVTLSHPNYDSRLSKQVIGVPGDRITHKEGKISINGSQIAIAKDKSLSGFDLHPIPEQVIPKGLYFVFCPHEDSFDSRYEEFGLIPAENIEEELWPVL